MFGFKSISKKFFGSHNDKIIKSISQLIVDINNLESSMKKLSDEELKGKTNFFREKINNGAPLDSLLVEAFSVVREASIRTLDLRPFDVQLMGGVFLHRGNIAEMKTGEGKTLTATLPVYLNALSGKGVHVVTVNDYLAKRDAEWMGKIYNFLGLSVGAVYPEMDENLKKVSYNSDVTYATNNELGFDYLRDNMRSKLEDFSQRKHNFAIVDEVDSILIDEARTPLIISGATEDRSDLYIKINELIPILDNSHFEIDEKNRNASLTDSGNEFIEKELKRHNIINDDATLYDPESATIVHHLNQALLANNLFSKNKDYIIKNNQIILIDEFTGRMMAGRRLANGLHQALEAKEKVNIQPENITLASVTFQNYFRLYEKLAGMTGTALTEADEFLEIYNLGVVEIPTNLEVRREDFDDQIFRTSKEKYNAVAKEIEKSHERGQPVLIGTTSIEKSEMISNILKSKKIKHKILNAKYHQEEAEIIAEAGSPYAVTIATNMAGRGTDIQLGGNLEMRIRNELNEVEKKDNDVLVKKIKSQIIDAKNKVINSGGLFVLATERHESRRIDNQLRGRSGRQGDPGKTMFFLSLEDDLMRIFGSEKLDSMLSKLGMKEGESIAHPWVNKALERAQRKVETRNFDIRKNLLKYDDVMNEQRKAIFTQRYEIIEEDDLSEIVKDMRSDVIEELVEENMPSNNYKEKWTINKFNEEILNIFDLKLPITDWIEESIDQDFLIKKVNEEVDKKMAKKAIEIGPEIMRILEKQVILQTIDKGWQDHLLRLEHLRTVVAFKGYAQKDPLNEYKKEAFYLFDNLLNKFRYDVVKFLSFLTLKEEEKLNSFSSNNNVENEKNNPFNPNNEQVSWGKVKRNDKCPCGSGKKFKHCHG